MVKSLLPLILFTACAGLPKSANRLPTAEALKPPCGTCIVPADSERLSEISRARTLVPSTEENLGHTIFEGPSRSTFVPKWNEEIRCKFVEPVAGRPMGGQTPKFNCEASIHGKAAVLRVKYQNPEILPTGRSSEENEGIWGELLASRMMWRMGFYAKEIYPIRLICENCPVRPWEYVQAWTEPDGDLTAEELNQQRNPARVAALVLPIAEVVVRSDVPVIETFRDQGWSWDEMTKLRSSVPDVQAEHDALSLLAAFFQHADNKAEQQELRCAGGSKVHSCDHPVMMIGDVGMTFGEGFNPFATNLPKSEVRRLHNLSIDLASASLTGFSEAAVWSDPVHCVTSVRFKEATGVPANEVISEAGRRLFLDRIGRLSDQDILDLFTMARIEQRGERITVGGVTRPVTVQDWFLAFKARVAKFRQVICPS